MLNLPMDHIGLHCSDVELTQNGNREEVKDFKVGDRVYPYPLYAKDDTSRAGTLGGFSEYILVPNAKKNFK